LAARTLPGRAPIKGQGRRSPIIWKPDPLSRPGACRRCRSVPNRRCRCRRSGPRISRSASFARCARCAPRWRKRASPETRSRAAIQLRQTAAAQGEAHVHRGKFQQAGNGAVGLDAVGRRRVRFSTDRRALVAQSEHRSAVALCFERHALVFSLRGEAHPAPAGRVPEVGSPVESSARMLVFCSASS